MDDETKEAYEDFRDSIINPASKSGILLHILAGFQMPGSLPGRWSVRCRGWGNPVHLAAIASEGSGEVYISVIIPWALLETVEGLDAMATARMEQKLINHLEKIRPAAIVYHLSVKEG